MKDFIVRKLDFLEHITWKWGRGAGSSLTCKTIHKLKFSFIPKGLTLGEFLRRDKWN